MFGWKCLRCHVVLSRTHLEAMAAAGSIQPAQSDKYYKHLGFFWSFAGTCRLESVLYLFVEVSSASLYGMFCIISAVWQSSLSLVLYFETFDLHLDGGCNDHLED